MKFPRQQKEELSLNLTPLIDVVFLLLIFFMVSTTFTKENHLSLNLPESSADVADVEDQVIEIIINENGNYSVDDQALVNNNAATLMSALNKVSGGNAELPLIVTADARTPHEFVVRAMDVAGQLGFEKLSITTKRKESESK